MSNEENIEPTANEESKENVGATAATDSKKDKANALLASLLALKEEKPKVFFGGVGGVVLLLVVIMSSGGKPEVTGQVMKNLAVGQRYVLKSANAYDAGATVRLVSAPGTIAAYDDTEEADRNGACQHMQQGTHVTVLELSDAYGKKNTYAKVRIDDEGSCKSNEGWALSIDIQ